MLLIVCWTLSTVWDTGWRGETHVFQMASTWQGWDWRRWVWADGQLRQCIFSSHGALERRASYLPSSSFLKQWFCSYCPTSFPSKVQCCALRCNSRSKHYTPMGLSILNYRICGDTSSLECTRTDHARSKSSNLPFVKKSQHFRKKCWSMRCRTRRGSECVSGKKDVIWHYFLYVIWYVL